MKIALHKCIAVISVTIHFAFAQTDPCKDETQKAETLYDMCLKLDNQSAGYTDCIKIFVDQKTKSNEACQTDKAPPAPIQWQAPATKSAPAAAFATTAVMSVAQALRESSLPGGCVADFTALMESDGFSMGKFVKNLPPAVAKVKVQMKSPLGKPKDGDKTSVGLTVGCIKSLPESPAEIQGLLKDIALKTGLSLAMDSAADAVEDYEMGEEGGEEKGTRFGIRIGYNYNILWDYAGDKDNVYGFGAGLALNIPIVSIMRLNAGLDLYYRELRISGSEVAISIPVLLQFGNSFYFASGIQLDFPVLYNEYDGYYNYEQFGYDNSSSYSYSRSSIDFDLAAGLGYRFTNFEIDFKYVHGLTSLFTNSYSYYFIGNSGRGVRDEGRLEQFCFGVSYFF